MSEPLYKVVFSGELMPGESLETVKSNLAQLFKSSPAKIDSLFTGRPVALKRELKEADADKYLATLRGAGALVSKETDFAASLSLVDHEEASPVTDPQDGTGGASMTCPKCGHEQAKTVECSACGIIIEKFLARQALQAATAPAAATDSNTSPYTSPQSSVAEEVTEFSELKVFTTNGRIGRRRCRAWSLYPMLIMLAGMILAALGFAITPVIGGLLIFAAAITTLVVAVQIGVQRLHDMGWSGWLWLLSLVPIANLVIALLMVFMPGKEAANRYGAPPPPNSQAVKILAIGCIVLGVLSGILSAVAIPSYQQYIEQAQQAQQQSGSQE